MYPSGSQAFTKLCQGVQELSSLKGAVWAGVPEELMCISPSSALDMLKAKTRATLNKGSLAGADLWHIHLKEGRFHSCSCSGQFGGCNCPPRQCPNLEVVASLSGFLSSTPAEECLGVKTLIRDSGQPHMLLVSQPPLWTSE